MDHQSELGHFFLASDSIVHTLVELGAMRQVVEQIPEDEQEVFHRIGYTIGAMLVFPGNRIDGKPTINGDRGMHPAIRDRIDLILECIRRNYSGEMVNPLGGALQRYADFFALFGDFKGYVDFFLLQDLLNADCSAISFALPFEGFESDPLPRTIEAYEGYRAHMTRFVNARNARIAAWARSGG